MELHGPYDLELPSLVALSKVCVRDLQCNDPEKWYYSMKYDSICLYCCSEEKLELAQGCSIHSAGAAAWSYCFVTRPDGFIKATLERGLDGTDINFSSQQAPTML